MRINPFDDDNGSFFVLVNDEEQHSLCSAFRRRSSLLAGRHYSVDRVACLDYIEQSCTDFRSKRLLEKFAAGTAN